MARLLVRALLTAVGWGVGGVVLAWGFAVAARFPSQGFDAGVRALRSMPFETSWFPIAAGAGALFALVAAGLRAMGIRASASRRVMALVGGIAMVPAVMAFAVAHGDHPFGVLRALPQLGLLAAGIGAVLGWCTLAMGGARE